MQTRGVLSCSERCLVASCWEREPFSHGPGPPHHRAGVSVTLAEASRGESAAEGRFPAALCRGKVAAGLQSA